MYIERVLKRFQVFSTQQTQKQIIDKQKQTKKTPIRAPGYSNFPKEESEEEPTEGNYSFKNSSQKFNSTKEVANDDQRGDDMEKFLMIKELAEKDEKIKELQQTIEVSFFLIIKEFLNLITHSPKKNSFYFSQLYDKKINKLHILVKLKGFSFMHSSPCNYMAHSHIFPHFFPSFRF